MPRTSTKSKVPLTWSPDQLHPEPEVEEFCHDLAAGVAASEAFLASFAGALDAIDAESSSVRARAHRLSKRPDVEARVLHLRKERRAPVEALSEADLHRLMGEVTDTLAEAHSAAQEAGAPSQHLSALRKEITRHVGRSGRMRPQVEVPHDASRSKAALLAMMNMVPLCRCHDRAPEDRTPETSEAVAQRTQKAMDELNRYLGHAAHIAPEARERAETAHDHGA